MLKKLGVLLIIGGIAVSTLSYVAGNNEAHRRNTEADARYNEYKHNPDLKVLLYWSDHQKEQVFKQERDARKHYIHGGRWAAVAGVVLFCLGADIERRGRSAIIGTNQEKRDMPEDREYRP